MSVSEEIAALRADLEMVQRESETALRVNLERMKKEKELQNGNGRRSSRGSGENGRGAHPSTGKAVVIQLIVEELLFRLWVPCGHVE